MRGVFRGKSDQRRLGLTVQKSILPCGRKTEVEFMSFARRDGNKFSVSSGVVPLLILEIKTGNFGLPLFNIHITAYVLEL